MSSSGSREPDRGPGWMRCAFWAVCAACERRVEVGQWQALVDVAGLGRRWVHEACALELGVTADAPDPTAAHPAPAPSVVAGPVRIVVVGSGDWPRDRAVEVRDSIEAVARGHRDVVIVHGTRRDPGGRLRGVDAWAALTAQRLAHPAEPHDGPAGDVAATVDELHRLRPTVVIAFPLKPSDPTETLAAAAELAGVPVLVHRGVGERGVGERAAS